MTNQQPSLRCAILGCGQVAHEYIATLQPSDGVTIAACADIDLQHAKDFAGQHGISDAGTREDILNCDELDIAVILTPPETHVELARAALDAGRHVYVEKPLALTPADSELLLAEATDRGLLVGAAPDTMLAPPARAARRALATGAIGTSLAADAALLAPGPEAWHSAPQAFYTRGAGPLGDMGPYYLGMLTYLLGPVEYVEASASSTRRDRNIRTGPQAGGVFQTDTATHFTAFLRTRESVLVTLTTSFDVVATTRPHLEIYGSDGTLVVPDPNFHDGAVRWRRRDDPSWRELPHLAPPLVPGRGLGVLDLAEAIRSGASECPTGQRAHHVVEIIDAIEFARTSGHPADLQLLREERRAGLR